MPGNRCPSLARRPFITSAKVDRRLPAAVTPELIARLSGLDVRARTIVEGFVAGLHRSPQRGFSVEFAEHREYLPGDDLRYVDWKVFGKSDRIFLKQYEEETNFACHLLVDVSESMRYRSEGTMLSKLEYAVSVAAALAYLITRQQDAVGLMTFAESIDRQLEPSGRAAHAGQLWRVLEETDPARVLTFDEASGGRRSSADSAPRENSQSPEDGVIERVLVEASQRMRRRGLVIVLSDLFDDPDSLLRGLKRLKHHRHDVRVLQILDRAEEEFPFDDPTHFRGLESSGERRIEPRALQAAYRAEFGKFLRAVQVGVRRLGMEFVSVKTDEPLDGALRRLLS
jgi:uncharacterized protein (DUF58 family)